MENLKLVKVNERLVSKISNDDDSDFIKNKLYKTVYYSVCDYDLDLTTSQIIILENMLLYAINVAMSGDLLKDAVCAGNIVTFMITCGEANERLMKGKKS